MTLPTFTLLDRLRKAREHVGLTQAAFAEKVGVSTVTYSRYESGARNVPEEVVERAAEAAGVPLEWFYQDDTTKLATDSPDLLPPGSTITWTPDGLKVS
ncbi:helix-turn-helix domain-containing protein [Rothia nasimurium]|uniref:helix-turn-helix domain-containing protein n=1 Tax=Rothia nasimurium TaxID=85336 RepID=UPI001F44AA08|nr:helix-turn-helix transcriptional regulator [Rothia nasimurium]